MKSTPETLKEKIRAARGEIPSDLVLKSGKVVNVFSGEVVQADVAMHHGGIVGVGPGYSGRREIDCAGKWIAPGFIDGHYHIESSMVLPSGLAAALAPWGTSAIVADPHEIANVMGLDGVRLMLEDSRSAPLDIFFMAPSCVPATHLESSGARLPAAELKKLLRQPRVLGLAEMMNYPGVLGGADEVLEKILLFQDRVIDGHAPGLGGRDLQGYLAAGIRSDHETTDRASGREKMSHGMMVMIREGTSARNLDELAPLVTDRNFWRFCFVSDDLHPRDILVRGHLNFMIRKAVQMGMDPVTAVRLATISPAMYFGLRGRGAVAPGFKADVVVLKDLDSFQVQKVFQNGKMVAEDGNLLKGASKKSKVRGVTPLKVAELSIEPLRIPGRDGNARVIELIPHQIVTSIRKEPVRCEDGFVRSDTRSDVLKLAVVERHHGTGRIGLGLVKGFGLKSGALASSVAHDSHNIIAVGVDDQDLLLAIRKVVAMGGGISVASGNRVLSFMALEIGGLMTASPVRDVADKMDELLRSAASLGCSVPEPFMILSFLALPVIPELRLTDLGLVDVNRFEVVPLFG
ncbi:MAG: adenine deaminase [Desulfobacteraceae bacterium]|nr:MAG: adenine deaminase [Desulfobacteraceae bacterium]